MRRSFATAAGLLWLLACSSASVQSGPDAGGPDAASPPAGDAAPVPTAPTDASPVGRDSGTDGAADATADASPDAGDAASDAGPGDAGVDSAPPPVPAVQYVGRWELGATEATAAYPASRAIVKFRGTAAEVTARDGVNETWIEVSVDANAPTAVRIQGTAPRTVVLAENLAAGEHTIEIYKRTEAFTGTLKLSSFAFPNGGVLLPPPPRKTRHIEIVGNSTLSGYGVDGVRGDAVCSTSAVHNARRSLIQLLATSLDAEDYAPTASGTGVLYNENPLDTNLIHVTYPRTAPRQAPLWDFTSWQPDVVVIMIGGTDLSNPQVDPPPSQAAFAAAYEQFLVTVRAKNPSAHIVAATSPTTSNSYPGVDTGGQPYMARTKMIGGIADAVAARVAAGDTKVKTFTFSPASDADLGACQYHPTFALYQRMAGEIAPFIRLQTGW